MFHAWPGGCRAVGLKPRSFNLLIRLLEPRSEYLVAGACLRLGDGCGLPRCWGGGFLFRCLSWGSVGLHLCALLRVEVADNARHIRLGLAIGRYAVILIHAISAGIVSSQSFDRVVVVLVQQLAEISRTAFHVGFGIER